jgi:hypothetical protein
MHRLILKYWHNWFPSLPSYQTFALRLNRLEPTFQTFGTVLSGVLAATRTLELDHLVNSLPVMLAQHGHSYSARVGREMLILDIVWPRKLDFMAFACTGSHNDARTTCHCPIKYGCAASHHDLKAFIEQHLELPSTEHFGDMAYPTLEIISHLKEQHTRLIAPQKKPKGKELTSDENYYNRLVRRIRQPIESLFNWVEEKTQIQRASKVRSTNALMIHCWEKLAVLSFSSCSTTDSHIHLTHGMTTH